MSNRIRILSSDHDNSKYFIDEKLKHALEVNQSITCFNGSFDLFFGYKVDSVDVDLINHNVTVVLHEDEYLNLTTCPKCGCSKLYLHGTTKINVADIPFLGMPTKLEITRKRYRCPECGSTHVIEPEMKIDGYKMTRRLHSYIASKFTNVDVSVASIAKDTGVYWNAVKDIEKSSLEKKFEYINTQGVQFIAMDEISVGKHHQYATLIIDAKTKRLLYACEGRTKEAIQPFFDLLKKRGHHTNILGASMDANAGFASIVKDNCPNAKIALDLYHMVANFNRIIDIIRCREVAKIRAKLAEESQTGKVNKTVSADLKRIKWITYRSYKDVLSDENVREEVKALIKANESISLACILADELRMLWRDKLKSPEEIRIDATNWVKKCLASGIKEIEEFGRKFTKHIENIIHAANLGLSNSVLEGCNNRAKKILAISYGFRDLKYYFLKLFQAFQGKDQLVKS